MKFRGYNQYSHKEFQDKVQNNADITNEEALANEYWCLYKSICDMIKGH
jgi:hypothetical protein